MTQDEAIQQLNITVDLLPQGANNRPGTKIKPTHITIHNTSNASKGADATMHAQYIKGAEARNRPASWHFTVDDKRTFKHLPTNEMAYHAKSGNGVSIGIEVCEHAGINQEAAVERAALLTALMMLAYGIPRDNVVSHHSWTRKDCPRVILRRKGGFNSFRDLAMGFLGQLKGGAAAGVAPEGMEFDANDPFAGTEPGEVSAELAAIVDMDEAVPMGFGPQGAVGGDDRMAQVERLIGQLALENFTLKQALESQGGTAFGLEPEVE
jgi:hypothetical protein